MATETVEHLPTGFTAHYCPVPRYGILQLAPGQSATGYGKKIATDYMVTLPGHPRKYRVYCICYSNNGTLYVIVGGKMKIVDSVDLEIERDRIFKKS